MAKSINSGNGLIHQITSGTAGWLTYEQMRRATNNLNEASLAKPIEDIARGQGYDVQTEFPLQLGKVGRPKSIDFMLVNHEKKLVVAIETKFKKLGCKMAGSISSDASRLSRLSIANIDSQIHRQMKSRKRHSIRTTVKNYNITRCVLVFWYGHSIMEQIRNESKYIKMAFSKMVKAMLPEGVNGTPYYLGQAMLGLIATKPVANNIGSLRAGSTKTYRRFWVASFFYQENWLKIP